LCESFFFSSSLQVSIYNLTVPSQCHSQFSGSVGVVFLLRIDVVMFAELFEEEQRFMDS
jgi:hypothetical protein